MTNNAFGILGGMGPEASLYFCKILTNMTDAKKDQEHIPYILYNKTEIPDRTDAILKQKKSPLPDLISGIKTLENLSCPFVVMPCNTAHYYFDLIQNEVKTPILDLINETIIKLSQLYEKKTKIGLLATSGTIHSKIYEVACKKKDFELIVPSQEIQDRIVMPTINQIKKGVVQADTLKKLQAAITSLKDKGAKTIILGCTEISLAFENQTTKIPKIDPLKVIAEIIIKKYNKKIIKKEVISSAK